MGYVQEYAPGRFRARKRVQGKLVSRSFGSKAEAWAWAESQDGVDDSGGPPGPPTTRSSTPAAAPGSKKVQTFAPAVTLTSQFLDAGGFVTLNQRPSTQAFNESIIRAHIRPRWGNVALELITHRDVQVWVMELAQSKLAPRTVQHILKVFRRVLDAAVRMGVITSNPTDGVVAPRVDEEEMRFLNTEEVNALTGAMRDRYRAFVPLCAYAGLRIGEAFGLRWKRVNLFTGTVEVAEIATEVKGRLVMGSPKTKAGRRTVSIPRSVVHALSDHQTANGRPASPDAFVFGDGDEAVRTRSFRRWWWAPAVTAAGLDPLRPHDLRHTAVAMWIAAGASPKEVAVRAGHTSVSFTLDRYGHLFPSMDMALANRLEELIERGVK